MEIGSKYIFARKKKINNSKNSNNKDESQQVISSECLRSVNESEEFEEIYQDEIADGLANAAKEQATVWAQQALEEVKVKPNQAQSSKDNGNNDNKVNKDKDKEIEASGSGNSESSRSSFLNNLMQIGKSIFKDNQNNYNNNNKNQASNSHSDQNNENNGVFSSARRVQPRYQQGRAVEFDNAVKNRKNIEAAIINKRRHLLLQAKQNLRNSQRLQFDRLTHQNNQNNSNNPSNPSNNNNNLFVSPNINQVDLNILPGVNSLSSDFLKKRKIIFDHGKSFKVGFSDEENPKSLFPAIIGRPRHKGVMVGMGQKDAYVGEEAQSKRGILTLKFAIEKGILKNLDDAEKLWFHAFYNELRVAPEEEMTILTFRLIQPRSLIEKITQIFFETFNVPALAILPQPLTSIFLTGSNDGVVIDIGEEGSHVCCVLAGKIIQDSIVELTISGNEITDYFLSILNDRGYSFTTAAERDIVKDMKENLTYVALDPQLESKKAESSLAKSYELPDGQTISISHERYRALEVLFTPTLLGKECMGVVEALHYSISRCPEAKWQSLYHNILLTGGTCKCPGFSNRVELELSQSLPDGIEQGVSAIKFANLTSTEKHLSSWLGASVLASVPDYKYYLATKSDYQQFGPACLADKWQGINQASPSPSSWPILPEGAINDDTTKINIPVASSPYVMSSVGASNAAIAHQVSDTNIIHLSLGDIVSKVLPPTTGDPEACGQCKAVLNIHSKLNVRNDNEEESFEWICEFCSHKNILNAFDREQVPKYEEADYVLEAPISVSNSSTSKLNASPLLIFCLDTSGSMCVSSEVSGKIDIGRASKAAEDLSSFNDGSNQLLPGQRRNVTYVTRLQCVQIKAAKIVNELRRTNPNIRPLLIAFNKDVSVYGSNGIHDIKVFTGDLLQDYDKLLSKGHEIGQEFISGVNALDETQFNLFLDHLYSLSESGITALGPALAIAVGMTASTRGSRIIVCTDGRANVGVGDLTSTAPEAIITNSTFYANIGEVARSYGTVVDVLSIRGEDCRMERLGIVADSTSGDVDIVDPIDLLTSNQEQIKNVLASNVQVTINLPNGLIFKENIAAPGGLNTQSISSSPSPYPSPYPSSSEPGSSSSSFFHKFIGNVVSDTELSLSFTPSDSAPVFEPGTLLTLQARIIYSLPNGARCLRVISKQLPITDDRQVAEENMNAEIVSLHGVKTSAALAQQGQYTQARVELISHQRLLQRGMKNQEQQKAYINYIVEGERLDGFMREQNYSESFQPIQPQSQQPQPGSISMAPNLALGLPLSLSASSTPEYQRANNRDDSAAKNVLQIKNISRAKMNSRHQS